MSADVRFSNNGYFGRSDVNEHDGLTIAAAVIPAAAGGRGSTRGALDLLPIR